MSPSRLWTFFEPLRGIRTRIVSLSLGVSFMGLTMELRTVASNDVGVSKLNCFVATVMITVQISTKYTYLE